MSNSKLEIDGRGIKRWHNEQGQLHREDGPAYLDPWGMSVWYKHNLCHREDGPAVEFIDGHKEWWINGRRHRLDGPAVERTSNDGSLKDWFVDGRQYTEKQFPIAVVMYLLSCNEETAEIFLEQFKET